MKITRSSWARIEAWLDKRGLELLVHDVPPVELDRWIGVIQAPDFDHDEMVEILTRTEPDLFERAEAAGVLAAFTPSPFGDHCVVCAYDRVIFDPAVSARPPERMKLRPASMENVYYGLSFGRKE